MRLANDRELRRLWLEGLGARTGVVTLAPNAASTTIMDARIRFDSPVVLVPTTANAAAELGAGTLHIAETGRVNGAVAIAHANNAQADRTFRFFIG